MSSSKSTAAKNKRTKPSNPPITNVNDLPKSVQWLLDFANLGSKPGVQNPSKVSKYHYVKRPPIEPPPLEDLPVIICSLDGAYTQTDRDGYKWMKYEDGSLTYQGKEDCDPTLKEFNEFLKETGIKKNKGVNHGIQKEIWKYVCYSFFCVMDKKHVNYNYYAITAEAFVHGNYKHRKIVLSEPDTRKPGKLINGLKYPHDGTLTQVVCAYILDFWHNHRERHDRLRQCKCCGMFEDEQVIKGARGRKRMYCSYECGGRLNQPSRKANNASQLSSRKLKKEKKQAALKKDIEVAKKPIVDWIQSKHGFSKKEAEEIYDKSHPNDLTSLDVYKQSI